jgi:hypothetical protein
VVCGFVMFRSTSVADAVEIYRGMLGLNGLSLPTLLVKLFDFGDAAGIFQQLNHQHESIWAFVLILMIALGLALLMPSFHPTSNAIDKNKLIIFFIKSPLSLSFLFAISVLSLSKSSPFLYFQF